MALLRKQESRLLMPSNSPSPGFGFALAGQGRSELLQSAKVLLQF